MNNKLLVLWLVVMSFLAGGGWQSAWAQAVFELGDVVVSSDEYDREPLSTTVVTPDVLERHGAETLDEAFDQVPGVEVYTEGKNQRFISIRGFEQGDVKVLIDGVPANETYFRTLDLSQFPAATVGRIRIERGLPSVLYGANAMGGVVNVITRQGGLEPEAGIRMALSDYQTHHCSASAGGQHGIWNAWITATLDDSDGFPLSEHFNPGNEYTGTNSAYHEDGGLRDNSDYRRKGLNAKVGLEGDAGCLYLGFDWQENEGGIPVEYSRWWRFSRWDQWQLSLHGEKRWETLAVQARAYYMDHQDVLENDTEKTSALGGRNWFDRSAYDDFIAGGQLQADWRPAAWSRSQVMLQYQFDQNRQREYNPRNKAGTIIHEGWTDDAVYETALWALALEEQLFWLDWVLTVGADYEVYDPVRSAEVSPGSRITAVNPQVTLQWMPCEEWVFEVGAGRRTRFPHMKELYSERGGGNPDLDPQYAWIFDAGAAFVDTWSPVGDVRIAGNVFYNRIRDMIQLVNLDDNSYQYQNIGRVRTGGVELSAELAPSTNFNVSINYTWLHSRDEELDRPLEKRPEHRANLAVAWFPGWGVGLFSQLRLSADQRVYPDGRSSETRYLPDTLLWDAGVDKTLGTHVTLFARVQNIADVDYDEGDGPMPGRRVWGGLEARW